MGAMTRVGFWTRAMTWAMVKVLPDPVTPSSTWCLYPLVDPGRQLLDGLRLIALGGEFGNQFKRIFEVHGFSFRKSRRNDATSFFRT